MSQLVHFVLDLQANMKLYHWMTKSFARHKASDNLVDKISELGDQFVEVYIGKYGRPTLAKKDTNIRLTKYDDNSVVKYLDNSIDFLVKELPKFLKKDDMDLLNIRDEMVGALNQTKYLFTFS
jgi:hypothetical protein